jgi:hypothetical protein
MITIRNSFIPVKDFTALTLWPFVFVRKDARMAATTIRHENIHGEQQKEMLILFFYLWYLVEWLVKLCIYRNSMTAYKNISFEREAYANQNNVAYLDERKPYAFLKYLNSNIN